MPTSDLDVIALRFGTFATSKADQYYRFAAYGEADGPIELNYYFWVVRGGEEITLVDCGFDPAVLAHRTAPNMLTPPVEALRTIGIDADQVARVIISHSHYDHIGNLRAFPNARFAIQRKELDFLTGPYANRALPVQYVEPAEVEFIVTAHEQGRVDVLDGDAEIAPGVRALLVGGHSPGQQIIRVDGEQPVYLCSDALHYYEEMERDWPFAVLFDLERMYGTYDLLNAAVRDENAIVVAGHDRRVLDEFAPLPGHDGLAVRLR